MRPGDVVARLGGDEFGVLVKDADTETAAVAAARLRAALGRAYALAGISLHVGASIGIATFPEHAQDASTLLRHADVAMYEAKRGRLGHSVYASEGDHHSRDRLELAGEMRHALANDELTLHYQPVADLATGRLLGVEALVRWRHPERGLLAARRLPARHRAHRAHARAQPPGAGDGDLPGRGLVPPGAPVARRGQPVGHRSARPLAGRRRLSPAAPLRHAGGPGHARGHRERPHDRSRPRHEGARRASRPGRAARARRLRDRVVVADAPAAHARPRDQDRPLVRGGHGHRGQLGRDRLFHRRPRPRPGPARRRRGDRGRGDVAAAARRRPATPRRATTSRARSPPPSSRPRRTRSPSARAPRRAFPCQPPDRHCAPFIVSLAPFVSNGRPFTFGEALPWSSIGVRTGRTRREAGTQSQRSLADGSATGSPGARTKDGV